MTAQPGLPPRPTPLGADTDFLPTPTARRLEVESYRRLLRIAGRRVPQPAAGTGPPVVLVPGFISGDASLTVLARHLRRRGLRTFGSKIGANLGCTEAMVARLLRRVEQVCEAEGRPVALVGHSRGGMIVKLVAIRRPDLIASIVVLSAPLTGTLRVAPHVRKQLEALFRLHRRGLTSVLGEDCVSGACAQRVVDELEGPFPESVRFASIYTRDDAIIDWHTCLDPAAELVEVPGSHTGMGTDPVVADIVAERVADRLIPPVVPTR